MDFTLKKYSELLDTLIANRYSFCTFEDALNNRIDDKSVILRHDVDLKAKNSLEMAKIEKEKGIQASYYFRIIPQSNQPEVIMAIAAIGHEIGYHYEDLTTCSGNHDLAIAEFEKNLNYFRQFYPVTTICMHGSPTSKYDNRDVWKSYNYRDFGIIGEPYFDIDYDKVTYLTDTARRWDGHRFSIRDKVDSKNNINFKHTNEIIEAAQNNTLPSKLLITTHPQRWTDHVVEWVIELIFQNFKNLIKWLIIR